eukprot:11238924-Alexandrium_andersonii.AAC.1
MSVRAAGGSRLARCVPTDRGSRRRHEQRARCVIYCSVRGAVRVGPGRASAGRPRLVQRRP